VELRICVNEKHDSKHFVEMKVTCIQLLQNRGKRKLKEAGIYTRTHTRARASEREGGHDCESRERRSRET
jgi:hypothetical protein